MKKRPYDLLLADEPGAFRAGFLAGFLVAATILGVILLALYGGMG